MARSDLTHVHRSSRAATDVTQNQWFEDDSEWEYEYDENETEDVYFTVDLTTHVPDAFVKQNKQSKNGKTVRGNLDERLRAGSSRYTGPAPTDNADSNDATPTPAPQDDAETAESAAAEIVKPARNVVQFVGLNTATPCLVYNNDFFTAYWLTDIGTELWITSPGVSKSAVHRGDALDVLGTSRARLMAMPAKLEPKYDTADKISDPYQANSAMDSEPIIEQAPNVDSILTAITAAVPQQIQTDSRLQAQAAFMEKFQALKRKKGEHDPMPMHSVKQYEYPVDAVQIRARALDELDKENEAKRQKLTEPQLIRQPGAHGIKVVKPGMRGNVRGTKATNPSQPVPTTESPDVEEMGEEDESGDGTPGPQPVAAGGDYRRGPAARKDKLTSLGIADQIHDKRK